MGLSESLLDPMQRYYERQITPVAGDGLVEKAQQAARWAEIQAKSKADSSALALQVMRNENVDSLIDKLDKSGNGKPTAASARLTDAIISKWKEPGQGEQFIKALNKDLADPKVAARLEAAIQADPAKVAAALPRYTPGSLATLIPDTAAPAAAVAQPKPQPAAAPQPERKVSAAPAAPRPAGAGGGRGFVNPAAAVAAAAVDRAAPAAAAPAPAAATQASVAAPPPPAGATAAAAKPGEADLMKTILKDLAKESDENISATMTPKFVGRLGEGLAAYGTENFPDLQAESTGFLNKMKAMSPDDRKKIADNLAKNPQLVRDLAKMMDDPSLTSNGMVKSGIRDTLKDIYGNPMVLADQTYTDRLSGKIQQAKDMQNGGVSGMLKGMGIDLGGVGGGLGAFFNGIMNWFRNFFGAFSGGMFQQIGNTTPGMGMWDRLSASMDQASRASRTLGYETVLPRNGANGPIGDGIDRDANGKPVMHDLGKKDADGKPILEQKYDVTKDHRVPVTLITGSTKDIYLTDNLRPSREANGNLTWIVATEVDRRGQSVRNEAIVLSPQESQKLYTKLQEAARAAGKELKTPDPSYAQPAQSGIVTTRYDTKGLVVPEPVRIPDPNTPGVYTQPVRTPNIESRPLEPNAVPQS